MFQGCSQTKCFTTVGKEAFFPHTYKDHAKDNEAMAGPSVKVIFDLGCTRAYNIVDDTCIFFLELKDTPFL